MNMRDNSQSVSLLQFTRARVIILFLFRNRIISFIFIFFFLSPFSSFLYPRPRSFSRAISDEGRHQLPLSDYQWGGRFA